MENLILVDTSVVIVTYDHWLDKVRLEQYGRIINDLPKLNMLFLSLFVKDNGEQLTELQSISGVISTEYNVKRSAKNLFHAVPTDTIRANNDPIYNEMNLFAAHEITTGDPRINIDVPDSGCDMTHPDINAQNGGVYIGGIEIPVSGFPMRLNFFELMAPVKDFAQEYDGWFAFKYQPGFMLLKTWSEISSTLTPAVFYKDSTCKIPTDPSLSLDDVWINEPVCIFISARAPFWKGVISPGMTDWWGHGTAICGLISAPLNDTGLSGIAPNCTTRAVKMVDDYWVYSSVDMIAAIEGSVAKNAHIISCSFGGPVQTAAEQAVFNYAYNSKSVLVVAAGNQGHYWNVDSDADVLDYPAALLTTIGVGACGWTDYTVANTDGNMDMPTTKLDFARMCAFSQKYPQVDLVAPGYGWIFHAPMDYGQMWLEYPINTHSKGYTYMGDGGTSFSCPAVAAAIGLCMARYLDKYLIDDPEILLANTPWNPGLAKLWMQSGAKLPVKLSNGGIATKGFGTGRLDIYNSVMAV